jgi:hypothetical protein
MKIQGIYPHSRIRDIDDTDEQREYQYLCSFIIQNIKLEIR